MAELAEIRVWGRLYISLVIHVSLYFQASKCNIYGLTLTVHCISLFLVNFTCLPLAFGLVYIIKNHRTLKHAANTELIQSKRLEQYDNYDLPSRFMRKGNRERVVTAHKGDDYNVASLEDAAQNIVHLRKYYKSFEPFLKSTKYRNEADLAEIAREIDDGFNDGRSIIESSIKQFGEIKCGLETTISGSLARVSQQEHWWEATNIFSPGKVFIWQLLHQS